MRSLKGCESKRYPGAESSTEVAEFEPYGKVTERWSTAKTTSGLLVSYDEVLGE